MTDKIIQDIETLRQVSEPVESAEEAQELIDRLKSTLMNTPNGIGLSAIQIGIPKRVSVIRWKKNWLTKQPMHNLPVELQYDWLYLINSEITELENEFIHLGEGCLSLPELYEDVKRYKDITITTQEIRDGKLEEATLYFYYNSPNEYNNIIKHPPIVAVAVQHEIDHMDGIIFTDKLAEKPKPIVGTKKVGRNDPCPCNSGKKYKKCCGK
jgi:peptide deformylase